MISHKFLRRQSNRWYSIRAFDPHRILGGPADVSDIGGEE